MKKLLVILEQSPHTNEVMSLNLSGAAPCLNTRFYFRLCNFTFTIN